MRPDEEEEEDEMAELEDLNVEEIDKLLQLQDLTGIDDLEYCRALLSSKDWDLEATVMHHIIQPPDSPPSPPPRDPSLDNVRINDRSSGPATGSAYTVARTIDFLFTPFRFVVRLAFNIVSFMFESIVSIFVPPPTSPLADVADFRKSFRTKYEPESSDRTRLPFHRGTFNQASDAAKKDLKFLLVYLHSPGHRDSDRYCRETLKSADFEGFLSTRSTDVILWGCAVEKREGSTVSQICGDASYPYMGVAVLRQTKMMFVGRVAGYITGAELSARLISIMADNEAYLVAARVDRDERNLTQEIRLEQDAAFQESLRQDREKDRKKREERDRVKREEEERELALKLTAERKWRIGALKVDLAGFIPDEPDTTDPETVRLSIKLPEGQRLERKFKKSHSIKCLYYYVFCHPDSPDEFDILTNFPRQILKCKPDFITEIIENSMTLGDVDEETVSANMQTFSEAGLGQSTMLFVNDLEA